MSANPVQGLASIGITVKLATNTLHYVTEISDLSGKPSMLDATCFADSMKKSVPGVQEGSDLEITYLFDNAAATSDFRVVRGLQTAGNAVAVEVGLPDGTKFASTGYVSTWVTGTKVNDLITAKASVALQSDWTITNPAAQ